MGTKTSVSFANIFMAEIENKLILQSDIKPTEWKHYIDDVFSLWGNIRKDVDRFVEQANKFRKFSNIREQNHFPQYSGF